MPFKSINISVGRGLFQLFSVLFIFFSSTDVQSQNEANTWYFGGLDGSGLYPGGPTAGVSFNGGSITVLSDGIMRQREGVASISDSKGNLLFYSDGEVVFNRKHQPMPNGTGLGGHESATQSGIIVPWPGDTSKYFLFTVFFEGEPGGLQYSVIDMTLDNGLGNVTTKGNMLMPKSCEKITALRHANGKDYWVVAHPYGSAEYYSYMVTSYGISSEVVKNKIGAKINTPYNTLGYMKSSPDGKKLVSVIYKGYLYDLPDVEIFDFDRQTGKLSNYQPIFSPIDAGGNIYLDGYGLEFSPSSRFIYVSGFQSGLVFQFDLTAGSAEQIRNSNVQVCDCDVNTYGGALQLAPDCKVYYACEKSSALGIIHEPDKKGTDCNYQRNSLDLKNGYVNLGLPNFIPSFFGPPEIVYESTCLGEPTQFRLLNANNFSSIQWDFGDVSSGSANFSSDQNPEHTYHEPDTFIVIVEYSGSCRQGVVSDTIVIGAKPERLFSKDTSLCGEDSMLIYKYAPGVSYKWQDGSANSFFWVSEPGIYWVALSNGCGSRTDTIHVHPNKSPEVSLGRDTFICQGQGLILSSPVKADKYLWSNGSKDSFIEVSTTGEYWLQVQNIGGCENKDTINIQLIEEPVVSMSDIVSCSNAVVTAVEGCSGCEVLWSTGEASPSVTINEPGVYWVSISNPCFNVSDTFRVEFEQRVQSLAIPDTFICGKNPVSIRSPLEKGFQWSNGTSDSIIQIREPGEYFLRSYNACGVEVYWFTVSKCPFWSSLYVPSIFTPNDDGHNDSLILKHQYIKSFKMWVYDRWGENLFYTEDINTSWDGTFKGELVPDGAYFYMIYAVGKDFERHYKKGVFYVSY